MAEKSFNTSNYKFMKIMIFNELATKISNITTGTIIAILNPKSMKPTVE